MQNFQRTRLKICKKKKEKAPKDFKRLQKGKKLSVCSGFFDNLLEELFDAKAKASGASKMARATK